MLAFVNRFFKLRQTKPNTYFAYVVFMFLIIIDFIPFIFLIHEELCSSMQFHHQILFISINFKSRVDKTGLLAYTLGELVYQPYNTSISDSFHKTHSVSCETHDPVALAGELNLSHYEMQNTERSVL